MNIREEIEKIEELYLEETDNYGDYYREYRSDEEAETEYELKEELELWFKENNVVSSVEVTVAFQSCGYDCSVISIAWLEDGVIEADNFLLECR